MTYGELLATHRKNIGLSQSKLANKARLDHSMVSRLENGQRKPTMRSVRILNEALGIEDGSREALDMLNAAGFTNGKELIAPRWNSVIALHHFLENNDNSEVIKVSMDAVVANIVGMTQYGHTKEQPDETFHPRPSGAGQTG